MLPSGVQPSPRDSRRRQPTVAAAAHARLAQSYAVCSRLMPSRHAPTHSCDANMRLSPVTHGGGGGGRPLHADRPVPSNLGPHGMSVCHEKRHRVRACDWCTERPRQALIQISTSDRTHARERTREEPWGKNTADENNTSSNQHRRTLRHTPSGRRGRLRLYVVSCRMDRYMSVAPRTRLKLHFELANLRTPTAVPSDLIMAAHPRALWVPCDHIKPA